MINGTTITPLTNMNRPCADILREMADTADAAGNVTVSAEFLDSLADEFEALAINGERSDVNRFRPDVASNT